MCTENRLPDADDWYELLVHAQKDLDATQSACFSAALILLLANQVGNLPVLRACLEAARTSALDPPWTVG
jgi:Protein of unknown function (DUF2783)